MTRGRPALGLLAVLLAPVTARAQGTGVSAQEYEGWRQYSVHCARCHGQDVLGNPVAADLLKSVAPGGPTAERGTFLRIVSDGRADRGMPGFEQVMTPEQMEAVYAYVKGRAEQRIKAGRPKQPGG